MSRGFLPRSLTWPTHCPRPRKCICQSQYAERVFSRMPAAPKAADRLRAPRTVPASPASPRCGGPGSCPGTWPWVLALGPGPPPRSLLLRPFYWGQEINKDTWPALLRPRFQARASVPSPSYTQSLRSGLSRARALLPGCLGQRARSRRRDVLASLLLQTGSQQPVSV